MVAQHAVHHTAMDVVAAVISGSSAIGQALRLGAVAAG